jgi:hypothetical protein
MIRRRRTKREIGFGFDSFLDIVANVVGIIIRMILVVWVGARSYTSGLQLLPRPEQPPAQTAMTPLADPLEQELEQHRRELARLQARLLEQLRQLEQSRQLQTGPVQELAEVTARRQALEQEMQQRKQARPKEDRSTDVSLAELQERSRRLAQELAALEAQSPPRKVLRYRTPVSRPLQTEELIFEVRDGRVAFIDIEAMLQEVRQGMRDKAPLLRTRWQTSDVSGAVGPFRLRYTVERQRDGALPVPDPTSDFRYGVSGWEVEPIVAVRGEAVQRALTPGSDFRQIVDFLDPQQTAVTFCVYPDSFAAYRQLRDYLHQRDLVVAGRPLPNGHPIASSRHGTLSRGQ